MSRFGHDFETRRGLGLENLFTLNKKKIVELTCYSSLFLLFCLDMNE